MMQKIISYNVNGIRAAVSKGFMEWLKSVNPDIVCLQEIKAQEDQIPFFEFQEAGYFLYVFPAKKKGYSGVAILSKVEPDNVVYGLGIEKYDNEGRFLRADFGDISVASIYHPSGSSGDERLAFKKEWYNDFTKYINNLKQDRKHLILNGDYNVCHKPIDIHDPIRNAKNSGFLPEEREWIDGFLKTGFIDTFRYFNDQPYNYTWWSYRANARAKNLGWRIDYQLVTESLKENLLRSVILTEAKHSDHCPIMLEMKFDI